MLGTSLIPNTTPVMNGDIVENLTPAQMATQFGSGNIKTPTANFSISYKGVIISGVTGVPFVVDAALAAFLSANNAPVV